MTKTIADLYSELRADAEKIRAGKKTPYINNSIPVSKERLEGYADALMDVADEIRKFIDL